MRAALVFAAAFCYHATAPVTHQADSRWTVFAAASLLHEGNLDLNEYPQELAASQFYAVECIANGARRFPIANLSECPQGRLYNFYPAAVSILAVPAVAAQLGLLEFLQPLLRPLAAKFAAHAVVHGYLLADVRTGFPIFELIAASIFVALATVLFDILALRHINPRNAILATMLFTACTPMLSTASRALWQHGILALILCAVLLLIPHPSIGPLLALGFFVRPTAAVPAVVIAVYLLRHHRGRAISAMLGGLAVVACFTAMNLNTYGTPLAPYFLPVREGSTSLGLHPAFAEALLGTLCSPARGVLVYMPFLLLVPLSWRTAGESWRRLAPWIAAAVAAHWLLVSLHSDWWGGHSFGPRYFTEVVPLLLYLLLPAFHSPSKPLLTLCLSAFLIHYRGAHSLSTQTWNVTPVNVNAAPQRLWNWKDLPFLR
ncbi:MAG: hypothetical protein JNK48_00010 [Bryobacterales bacterium]|nr:hypothetical protein [Bryobacterales bacterium]